MRSCIAVTCIAFATMFFESGVAIEAQQKTPSIATAAPSPAEQIRGQWVAYRDTPNGKYMTIKEHTGDRTVVTTYDPNKKPVESHRSEYRVDLSGSVPIFRYKTKWCWSDRTPARKTNENRPTSSASKGTASSKSTECYPVIRASRL